MLTSVRKLSLQKAKAFTFGNVKNNKFSSAVIRSLQVAQLQPQSAQFGDSYGQNHSRRSQDSIFKFGELSWRFLLIALFAATATSVSQLEGEKPAQTEKIYSIEEVSKHNTRATGVWVIYKDGVYDISKFVANHPGGVDKIMMAAGGDIAPFWNLYRQHFNSAAPMELLRAMRIGSLSPEDVRRMQANHNPADDKDPYNSDPALSPVLKYISRKPINAEPPNSFLTDDWVTPVELWFVRNHHPVVHVSDPSNFNVQVQFDRAVAPAASSTANNTTNDANTPVVALQLSVEELKTKFAPVEVVATLQCGGNRRLEMSALEKTNGSNWNSAISTARWKGARLRDILLAAGLNEDDVYAEGEGKRIQHIHFLGADNMQASIPVRKALARDGDVIIAYEMNGQPIPSQHGAPLRAIVPGHAGVRNVKWLNGIVVSDVEAPGPWQRGMAYKGFGPSVRSLEGLDVESIPSLQEQPVQSSITLPASSGPGSTASVTAGEPLTVRGYAYSGGGRGIVRVDVSIDDGVTWRAANLLDGTSLPNLPGPNKQPLDRAWAWTFWECDFDIPDDFSGKKLTIISKATDAAHNVQPDSVAGVWNLRGINNNAWQRVAAQVVAPVVEEDDEE